MKVNKRRLGLFIIVLVFLVLVVGLILFIRHRMLYAVSNAVFVETDQLVFLSFQRVNGRILTLSKDEGEPVQAGEIIARLDEGPYAAAVARLEAEEAALTKKIKAQEIFLRRLEREIELLEQEAQQEIKRLVAKKEALCAQSQALKAQISQLERDVRRFQKLWEKKLIPKHQLEELQTRLKARRKDYEALKKEIKALSFAREMAQTKLARARNQRKEILQTKKEISALKEKKKALEKALFAARLDLANCSLKSPLNGLVAKRFHVVGDVVGPGEPVLALVDPKELYVLVLLEETKLHGVEVGCRAKIKIDAYPREKFEGKVEEILPATAAKFALVPRDISAGEFTKVAQRVPVKIALTKGPVELLRVGLGGEVEIRRK